MACNCKNGKASNVKSAPVQKIEQVVKIGAKTFVKKNATNG